VAPDRGLRPAPLLLSILLPALLAGSFTAYLVLPGQGRGAPTPVAMPPASLPEVDLEARSGSRRPARPLGITIPAARVQGPVDPIRAVRGELEIPPPGRAGWFRGGPRPGEPGRAVIVSHVDSQEGPALFYTLSTLKRGTRILVEDRRGGIHRFRLTRRRQIEKSRFRPRLVYGPSRRPVLVLITCGGPFTDGEGYRDNVILYARAA
jgi:Sortase domain